MQIPRPRYLQDLISREGNGLVKVITGVRRCGKSYLMSTLFKDHLLAAGVPPENIIEFSFEGYANAKYRNPEVTYPLIKSRLLPGRNFLLLDEVQLLKDFVPVLTEFMRMPGVDVYVTGSNAKQLSKDIATEFRGRGDQIHLRPLSFSEFMNAYDGPREAGIREYSLFGGLPTVVLKDTPEEKMEELETLLSEVYLNDIEQRNKIRKKQEFSRLLDVVASSIGSLASPAKLADTFSSVLHAKISPATVQKYLGYLDDAFLIETGSRYDIKGRKYIGAPFKCYFTDLGLRNARLHFRQHEEPHVMENIVYNELRTRRFNVDVGVVQYRYRNPENQFLRGSLEVDFVCNKGYERYYVQSALTIKDAKKASEEKRPLLGIDDSFRKVIVVDDPVPTYHDEKGILIVNLLEFLTNPRSLDL